MGEFLTLQQCREEKRIKHYSSSQKILLVGEGDFSFSACLARAFGSAANTVATSLDSKETLLRNYKRAATNLKVLEDLGCTVVHGVNVASMSSHPLLCHNSFDCIVFNFPHAGFYYKEKDESQIELHKDLVEKFLRNAKKMVGEKGEIHITHKTNYPFSEWEIVEVAESEGLYLKEEAKFSEWDYPGYVNKRGHGIKCDQTFPVGSCSTFKFSDYSLAVQLEFLTMD